MANTSTDLRRRPIRLRIAGADLLLNGRFDNWQSASMTTQDLDEADVRLIVDATSSRGSKTDGRDLFSFESTKVRRAGKASYEVEGTLEANGNRKSQKIVVEAPPAHSAFFAVSFTASRNDFGDGWRDLVDVSGGNSDGDDGASRMNARAWLREPVLAAA